MFRRGKLLFRIQSTPVVQHLPTYTSHTHSNLPNRNTLIYLPYWVAAPEAPMNYFTEEYYYQSERHRLLGCGAKPGALWYAIDALVTQCKIMMLRGYKVPFIFLGAARVAG